MTIRFHRILEQWYPHRDECEWVLGTIIHSERSTYRKAGAMMLFNSLGQMYGMLSGGCLEGNLLQEARKVLVKGKSNVVVYDLKDESDSNWQKGLGCGGAVSILLQQVHQSNDYLGLEQIHQQLLKKNSVVYLQGIDKEGIEENCWQVPSEEPNETRSLSPSQASLVIDDGKFLATRISPAPHLRIFGGGLDAIPLAQLAENIGWHVSVVDSRTGYAKEEHFPHAEIIRLDANKLTDTDNIPEAVIIMTHNIELDAAALVYAKNIETRFVGLLGPKHRREKIEHLVGLNPADFSATFYCGPVGLDIGAKLPETIALSILAQCHHVIEGQ